ncbi:MAG: hypothetical protein HOO67_05865 [Candidatus Peribacteraceae bacterium]|nr:hypothetical protein [Candidatus Peribacteraceae bacterium]
MASTTEIAPLPSHVDDIPALQLFANIDAETAALVELDLLTGGTEESARRLLMEARLKRNGTSAGGASVNGEKNAVTKIYNTDYKELLEPMEVGGYVKSRVTEAEFDSLRTEVGETFFREKKINQSSRDRGAYTMLMELRRREVPLSGYRPAHGAKFVTGVTLAEREKILDAFENKPGRKALRQKSRR